MRSWTMSTPPRSAAARKSSGRSSQTRYRWAALQPLASCVHAWSLAGPAALGLASTGAPPAWAERAETRIRRPSEPEPGNAGAGRETLRDRSSTFDVAVVGGGVIGLSVAWRAAQRGMRVIVLERAEPGGGASWVAAGMIAPISEARPKEQSLLRLSLASARAYPEFVAELAAASGRDPGLSGLRHAGGSARPRRGRGTGARACDARSGSGCRCGACARARRGAWSRGLRPRCGLRSTSPTTTSIEPHALTARSGGGAAARGRRAARRVRGRRGACDRRPRRGCSPGRRGIASRPIRS